MEALPILHKRLLLARQRADLSQQALAARTGLYKTDIAKIERGKALPTVPHLKCLALALGVSTDYLLGLTETPTAVSLEPERQPGGWEGRVWVAPDFDETDANLIAQFEEKMS